MAVCYLEVDDEITGAIKRIRGVTDGEAIVVIPPGSKIATSRINFKLLVREAAVRRMNIAAVSAEPPVRALAISAGLPAYDSIAGAEQALATFREQERRLSDRINPLPERRHPVPASAARARDRRSETSVLTAATTTMRPDTTPDDTAVLSTQASAGRARRSSRRGIPIAPLLVVGLLALLLGGVTYGAYVFLPTATITLRPKTSDVQTPSFQVTADPHVAVADPAAEVIPAQLLNIPLHVSGEFPATGIEAHDTRASGTVRFRSENTLNAVAIPGDTVVSTSDGVDFVTQDAVSVPRASFATGPTTADVGVRAVRAGLRGNVDANAITVVPSSLAAQLISVRNPGPITGGRHVEEQTVSQTDYDAAVASLTAQLPAALAAAVADPANVPRGLTVYPDSALIGLPEASQPATVVVGTVAPSFTLAVDAAAQVTAVNESQLDAIADARVSGLLQPGQALLGRARSTHDAGTVSSGAVVYNVVANAVAYTQPDTQAVAELVRGKPLSEARTVLEQGFGTADIVVWPEFIDRMPDQTARINISVVAPSATP